VGKRHAAKSNLARSVSLTKVSLRAVPQKPWKLIPAPERGFTPVYEAGPTQNVVSMNAGDLKLYVGGGSINLAFAEALSGASQRTDSYTPHHQELFRRAAKQPGECICWDGEKENPNGDLLAACARVPPGDFVPARPDGFVAVSIFKKNKRPHNEKNIGMCYIVGPMGATKRKGAEEAMSRDAFISRVQRTAENAMMVATHLNTASKSHWPVAEIMRVCLFSGGVYKHPDVSTDEVAEMILRGLLQQYKEGSSPTLELAPAGGAFSKASRKI